MIKIDNVVLPSVDQWEAVIRGMRNPLNSWERSDSGWNLPNIDDENRIVNWDNEGNFYAIGDNDFDLMKRLRAAGTDHRKFLRMIPVYVDITCPLYFEKEFSTYKIGTVTNSCSTMHKIAAKEFTLEDFSTDHLTDAYGTQLLLNTIDFLNEHRKWYNIEIDPVIKKNHWWQMIQLLPSSYNQRRTVFLNYEVLANMYKSRKNHKLNEWRDFCNWIESLPCSKLITGEVE